MTLTPDDARDAGRTGPPTAPLPPAPRRRVRSLRNLGLAIAAGVVALWLGTAIAGGLGTGREPVAALPVAATGEAGLVPGTLPSAVRLTYAVVGAPTTSGFTVSTKTIETASVRLKVATDRSLTAGAILGSSAVPDADGWAKPSITGLAPGTTYYYAVELTSSSGATSTSEVQGAPATLPTGPASFTVAFGSCLKPGDGDTVALDHLLARSPDLFLHLGDFHYADNSSTSQAAHLADLEGQLARNPALRSVLASVPTLAIKSDHDAGGGNDAAPGPYTAPNRAAYKQVFATPPLVDPNGLYWSTTVGRVKFIFTDHRYLRTDISMMGDAQEAWFRNELTTPEPVKVWVQDSTWNTREDPNEGGDKWSDHPAEHTALGEYIAASAVGQVISLHGDMHGVAADDGSNNEWGGFPTFAAGPFRQISSIKGGPWSNGLYPPKPGSVTEQYAMLTVTDTGSSIALRVSGYDADDVERVTMTVNVVPKQPGGA